MLVINCNFKLIMICEILHEVCSVNPPECSFISIIYNIGHLNFITKHHLTNDCSHFSVCLHPPVRLLCEVCGCTRDFRYPKKKNLKYSNQVILGQLIGCPQNVKLLLLRDIFVARGRRMHPWTCRTYCIG